MSSLHVYHVYVNCSVDEGPASTVDMVLETGTVRAWQGMDKLERAALLATNGFRSSAFRSGGHKLVCIL